MAFIGNGGGYRRISLPTFYWLKGATRFTMGGWFYFATGGTGGYVSYVRMDGTFTFCQVQPSGQVWSVWWDPSNVSHLTNVWGTLGSTLPLNQWVYLAFTYEASGKARNYIYTAGIGLSLVSDITVGGTALSNASGTAMYVGCTEYGTECVPSGSRIAELTILPRILGAAEIVQLAQNPQRFAKDAVLYMPLRSPSASVAGRSPQALMSYDTDGRIGAITPSLHPPVRRQRPTGLLAATRYTYAAMSVTARKTVPFIGTLNPRLPVLR